MRREAAFLVSESFDDYHINVFWSEEDGQYVADIPDLAYCSAMGATPEEALSEVLIAKRAWLESVAEAGKAIPRPQYRRAFQHLGPNQHGEMAIAGRRLLVYMVLGEYETGMSAEAMAESAEIPIAAVFEALAYAAEHSEEMEAITRANKELDERYVANLPEHLREMARETFVEDERRRLEAILAAKEARRAVPLPDDFLTAQLASAGIAPFREWNEEGEGIYDGDAGAG